MAEATADGIWRAVVRWDSFARDVVGGQLGSGGFYWGKHLFTDEELTWLATVPNP